MLVPPIHKRTCKKFLVYVCGGDLTVSKSSDSREDGTLQISHPLLQTGDLSSRTHLHYSLKKCFILSLNIVWAQEEAFPPHLHLHPSIACMWHHIDL